MKARSTIPTQHEIDRLHEENSRLKDAEARRAIAENALVEHEMRYRDMVEHAQDIIYSADRHGYFVDFNPAAVETTGFSADEIQGMLYLDLIHPSWRRQAKRFYVRQIKEEIPTTYFEYPVVTKEGVVVWLGQHVQLIRTRGNVVGIQAIARDITRQRQNEEQLRLSRLVLEGRIRQRTAALREANEALRLEVEQRKRDFLRQRRLMEIAAAVNASVPLVRILHIVRDGILEIGVFDRVGVFLYDRDNSLLVGACGTDRAGKPTDVGTARIPVHVGDTMPMQRVALGELDFYLSDDFTRDLNLRPDDPMYGVHAHAVAPLRANGVIVGVVTVDNVISDRGITEEDIQGLLPFAQQAGIAIQNAHLFQELSQTQKALSHSEKLRAIGELASGVAHNLNNVLAVILGYAELIEQSEGDQTEVARCSQIIATAATHGADIVRRMQQFARKEVVENPVVFDLAALVRETLEFTRPAWHTQATGRGIEIDVETTLPPELMAVGVPSEIREVLVNMITNAVDAMPEGGALMIEGTVEQSGIVLKFTDTGHGMTEAVRQRVFEPFFTTKAVGKGIGLGLAVTWGIIQRHDGTIRVDSRPGAGTTFHLILPLPSLATVNPAALQAERDIAGLRVLLVEDEDVVRQGIARLLEKCGSVVTQASSAAEAQKWLEANSAHCDIVLSDQGMVGRTGLDLFRWTRERFPAVHRVLLSGWGDQLPSGGDNSAAEMILAKPITQKGLVSALAGFVGKAPPTIPVERLRETEVGAD